jgi:ribonuclease J
MTDSKGLSDSGILSAWSTLPYVTHSEPSQEERLSEQDLERRIVDHIKGSPGIVLAALSPMHVDRLVTFLRSAMRTRRTVVIDPYTAFVMHLIHHQCGIHDPHRSQLIRIYYNQGFLKSYKRKHQEDVYQRFLRRRVEMQEILASAEKFLMRMAL